MRSEKVLRRLSEVSCGLRTGLGAGLGEEGSEILRDVRIVKGRVPPKETAVALLWTLLNGFLPQRPLG